MPSLNSNLRRKLGHVVRYVRFGWSQARVPSKTRTISHIKRHDFELVVFGNEDVGRALVVEGVFENPETIFFTSEIRADDTCFDIGGNVGYFTLLFARAAGQGVVHTFEPIALNVAMITLNARLNGFENITVNQCAIGDKEGSIDMERSVDSAYSSIHSTGRSATAEVFPVNMVTLDEYVIRNGITKIDILKVDVEGAEGMVLNGANSILSDSVRRPRIVLLELAEVNLKPFATDIAHIMETMRAFGYRPHVVNPDGTLRAFVAGDSTKHPNVIFKS